MYWPAGVKHGVDLQNMKSGLIISYLKYHDPKKIYEEANQKNHHEYNQMF